MGDRNRLWTNVQVHAYGTSQLVIRSKISQNNVDNDYENNIY